MTELARLGDRQRPVDRDAARELALLARRPQDLDALDTRGIPQAEVERQNALRQVSRLAVVVFRIHPSARTDLHRGAQAVAVGDRAVQDDLEEVDLSLLGEVADQDLRRRVEL